MTFIFPRPLAPAAESMEDELRVAIRHAAAILLRRAQRLDLPKLITQKLLQAVASHIDIYVRAREKCELEGGREGRGGEGRGGEGKGGEGGEGRGGEGRGGREGGR